MKNIIKLFTAQLFIIFFSCEAQTTATLQQMEQCSKRQDKTVECPGFENIEITQVKDIDNRLNAFEGTWKGTFEGKQIELNLIKKVNFGEYDIKWDKLIGKLKIKDVQGNILFDSFQNVESNADPKGINFQYSVYEMRFSGKSDCVDGKIFLQTPTISLNGSIKTKIFFYPNGDAIDTPTCPKLLPLTWADLTKQ
ncbi:DUF6705 family protein [Chryseobacterium binzhouense]|uniref:DUF6705 family protein n=1 Tax=Chryseobacterium binzhouense TaxID=2593646 RepID=UPI00117F0CDF|nr:DUF6705 family protein [Chryseobacterium binzhouense]